MRIALVLSILALVAATALWLMARNDAEHLRVALAACSESELACLTREAEPDEPVPAPAPPPIHEPAPPPAEPCPLEVSAVRVGHNLIGSTTLRVTVHNRGDIEVNAFRVAIRCRDGFGDYAVDRITHEHVFLGRADDEHVRPGHDSNAEWTAYNLICASAEATDAVIFDAHLVDGSRWQDDGAAFRLEAGASP